MRQRVYKKVDKYSWQKKNDHTSSGLNNKRKEKLFKGGKALLYPKVSTSHFDVLLLNVLCKYNVKIKSGKQSKTL